MALLKCLWRENLLVVPPRFTFTVLRYCQPLIISRAIAFVTLDLSPYEDRNEAFRLILFTFLVYTGMAVGSRPICGPEYSLTCD